MQDQKRLKVDDDDIDIDSETMEETKVSTNTQVTYHYSFNTYISKENQVADEEIEIAEEANSQVSSTSLQTTTIVAESKVNKNSFHYLIVD